MKTWMLAACMAATCLASGHAAAQFKDADDAVEYRQGALHVLGNHFGRINAMVFGKVPFDAHAVQVNADIVAVMIKLPWAAFIDGSGKGETDARPEIWAQPDKFKAAALKAEENADKLAAAAKTGNLEQIKAAFGATGQSCKACHDDFRKKH